MVAWVRLQLHPLSPAEVMSHYRTVNPSAGSNCQPTCTQEFKYLEAFSEYLLSTRGSFRATRYFAAMVSGAPTAPQPVANVLFLQNTTSVDAGPLFINLVDSALLRLSSGNTKAVITVRYPCIGFTVLVLLTLGWWLWCGVGRRTTTRSLRRGSRTKPASASVLCLLPS